MSFPYAVLIFICLTINNLISSLSFPAAGAFGVLCVLELCRFARVAPHYISRPLDVYMSVYRDARDSGPLIVTHLYLLVGCALPLWAHLPTIVGLTQMHNDGALLASSSQSASSTVSMQCGSVSASSAYDIIASRGVDGISDAFAQFALWLRCGCVSPSWRGASSTIQHQNQSVHANNGANVDSAALTWVVPALIGVIVLGVGDAMVCIHISF